MGMELRRMTRRHCSEGRRAFLFVEKVLAQLVKQPLAFSSVQKPAASTAGMAV